MHSDRGVRSAPARRARGHLFANILREVNGNFNIVHATKTAQCSVQISHRDCTQRQNLSLVERREWPNLALDDVKKVGTTLVLMYSRTQRFDVGIRDTCWNQEEANQWARMPIFYIKWVQL